MGGDGQDQQDERPNHEQRCHTRKNMSKDLIQPVMATAMGDNGRHDQYENNGQLKPSRSNRQGGWQCEIDAAHGKHCNQRRPARLGWVELCVGCHFFRL